MRPTRLLPLLLVLAIASCSSTRIENTWRDPAVDRLVCSRLLVVAPYPDGAIRRLAEDAMRSAVTTMPAVVSYDLIPAIGGLADVEQVLATARKAEADAIITARLMSDRTEVHTSASAPYPPAYATMRGYWGPHYGMGMALAQAGDPTVTSTRLVAIEVCIHRVADGKLVWTALTSTRNPASIDDLIADCARAVRERLIEDGLIVKSQAR
jgi:hypothetical protein